MLLFLMKPTYINLHHNSYTSTHTQYVLVGATGREIKLRKSAYFRYITVTVAVEGFHCKALVLRIDPHWVLSVVFLWFQAFAAM
jgi:hypothetical protein